MMIARRSSWASSCACSPRRTGCRRRSSPERHRSATHTDLETVRAFAPRCDVVTFDHEHVPAGRARGARRPTASRCTPTRGALRFAQDKLVMRERLHGARDRRARAGRRSRRPRELEASSTPYGWPRRRQDPARRVRRQGRARRVRGRRRSPTGSPRLGDARPAAGGAARSRSWSTSRASSPSSSPAARRARLRAWPVVETVQRDGVCAEVLAPGPATSTRRSPPRPRRSALRIAGELGVTGVLAVELFEVPDRPAAHPRTSSTSSRCDRTTAATGPWTAP